MRVQLNGRVLAFQASYVGPIPITRSIIFAKAKICVCSSAGQSIALLRRGSGVRIPSNAPWILFPPNSIQFVGVSPSGKARDFDSLIREFKSCHPNQSKSKAQWLCFFIEKQMPFATCFSPSPKNIHFSGAPVYYPKPVFATHHL